MAKELEVFALDDGANKHLTMTREQITAAIIEAVNNGTIDNIDAGFITKIKELNNNKELQFWIGTNAEFDALKEKSTDTLYVFTDDPTIEDINNRISELDEKAALNFSSLTQADSEIKKKINDDIEAHTEKIKNGDIVAKNSTIANRIKPITGMLSKCCDLSAGRTLELNFPKSNLSDIENAYTLFIVKVTLRAEFGSWNFAGITTVDLPIVVKYNKTDGSKDVKFINKETEIDVPISTFGTGVTISGGSTTKYMFTGSITLRINYHSEITNFIAGSISLVSAASGYLMHSSDSNKETEVGLLQKVNVLGYELLQHEYPSNL